MYDWHIHNYLPCTVYYYFISVSVTRVDLRAVTVHASFLLTINGDTVDSHLSKNFLAMHHYKELTCNTSVCGNLPY